MAKGLFKKYEGPIVGPILPHLHSVGLNGSELVLATAYYSGRALFSLKPKAPLVRIFTRLDLETAEDWANGYIDPPSLLLFKEQQEERGAVVELFTSRLAHAKVYFGDQAAIIGSANLTLRGFGGGQEVIYRIVDYDQRIKIVNAMKLYAMNFDQLTSLDLADYIKKYKSQVNSKRKRNRIMDEDHLPRFRRSRHFHLGEYSDFLRWLSRKKTAGAIEIHERADGKNNLSGHIRSNFYGIRQLFLSFPEILNKFALQDPETYKLSKDSDTEMIINEFVEKHAIDEDDFEIEMWRTYLPIECGGRAKRHGGTIGNLNYMIPFVAQYLFRRIV